MKRAPGIQASGRTTSNADCGTRSAEFSTSFLRIPHSSFRAQGAAGFTLIEVAVSVAILGGVIAALLLARSRAMQAHVIANEMMTCTRLCATQAAALRAGVIGEGEGDFETPKGYHWGIKRLALDETMPQGLGAYEIHITPPAHDDEAGVTTALWLPVSVPEGPTP